MNLATFLPLGAFPKVEYKEIARSADLSIGVYLLPRGAKDPQRPHAEDEVYHITRGTAIFEHEGSRRRVGPGSVLLVKAGEAHRFVEIEEDLVALVAFGPAEGSRDRSRGTAPATT